MCVLYKLPFLVLLPLPCPQSPMSEAFSPSMEEIGEACVAYDSGMSESSSNSAITQEQNVADAGVRALPHGESSYSISQKWAEVGVEETACGT